MKVHLLHGIHTPTGDKVVEGLIPYLHADVVYPDYGWIAAIETRRINPVVIGTLAPFVQPDDVMIGHSNGAAIIYGLLQAGVKMRGCILINGALKRDIILPPCVKFCHVYWNPGDDITEVARIAEEVYFSPVDPNWGDMGHAGYLGNDPRVTFNPNCSDTAGLPIVSGHSDIFTPEHIRAWGPTIDAHFWGDY